MTEKSGLFDNIRIKSRRGGKPAKDVIICDWEKCEKPGTHRAPKSHRSTGEFHNFCMEHVRKYNQSFNYFAENEEDDMNAAQRRSAATGERPTWKIGTNPAGKNASSSSSRVRRDSSGRRMSDPSHLFARLAARSRGDNRDKKPTRRLVEADRRALEVLGLKGRHQSVEIKASYKALVKIHHPDANGGDRSSEDRLRAIIVAYNHLKKKGLV